MSILPDISVWLALALDGHGYHQLVRSWMRNQEDRVFFCRVTQQGLLRLLTTKVVVAEYDAGHLTNTDGCMERVRCFHGPCTYRICGRTRRFGCRLAHLVGIGNAFA